jgi:cysteine-rich repeat protein
VVRRLVLLGWVVAMGVAGCATSKVPCEGAACAEPDAAEAAEADANEDCTPVCGDGVRCRDEACDDGYTDACGACNADCSGPGTGASCGDGTICPQLEMCDDGFADACGSCNADCSGPGTVSTCGDDVFCPEFEFCDDGYTDACGSCNVDCTAAGLGAVCGDAFLCPELEGCDIGPDPCNQCAADCSAVGSAVAVCGDSKHCTQQEQCEDGNMNNGDGCSMTCQNECNPLNDISVSATPSTSGGGSDGTGYGPARLNDGHYEGECASFNFCWITASTSPGTAYYQYNWASAVPVRRIAIDTQLQNTQSCSAGVSRNVAGATVQYWTGAAWATAGTVTGQTNDWSFTFPSTVNTTAIRLYGAYTSATGQGSNPIVYEWDVFSCL